jgi:hypothetical protein
MSVCVCVCTQHTLRICNIYYFYTAKMVTLTRLTIKVYTYIACLVFVVTLYLISRINRSLYDASNYRWTRTYIQLRVSLQNGHLFEGVAEPNDVNNPLFYYARAFHFMCVSEMRRSLKLRLQHVTLYAFFWVIPRRLNFICISLCLGKIISQCQQLWTKLVEFIEINSWQIVGVRDILSSVRSVSC